MKGSVELAGTKRCTATSSSTLLKALAMRYSLGIAIARGLYLLELETDLLNLAQTLNGELLVDPTTMMIF